MCFKIIWASLIVGSKFIIFVLFYFVFEGSFSKYKPPGGLYFGGFFALRVWEAYTWGGGAYFRNFMVLNNGFVFVQVLQN